MWWIAWLACRGAPVSPADCGALVDVAPDSALSPACTRDAVATDGPGTTRLVLATSDDGARFVAGPTLAAQASVPGCVAGDDGLRVYFVMWRDGEGRPLDTTVVAHTEDGASWRFAAPTYDGGPAGFRDERLDPAVLAGDDGLALYAVQGAAVRKGPPARVFRYRSADGVAFTFSPGPLDFGAVYASDRKVLDPAVARVGANVRLWASGDLQRGHYTGVAADGVAFRPTDRLPLDHRGRVKLANVTPRDEGAWAWAWRPDGPPGIVRYDVAVDGTLVNPVDVAVEGPDERLGDPAVCRGPDGRWWMVYVEPAP